MKEDQAILKIMEAVKFEMAIEDNYPEYINITIFPVHDLPEEE